MTTKSYASRVLFGLLSALLLLALPCAALAQTAAILPNAKTQFIDANGNPLIGGKVYFYIPTTTTPKTTWADPYEATPNSQPVVLDSSGSAFIFGQGNYTETVYDANNNLVWSGYTSAYELGVNGPSTSVVGDIAIWNNTTGTLLADSSAISITSGNPTITGATNVIITAGSTSSRPLIDFYNYYGGSSMDLRFFSKLSNASQAISGIINPGFAVATAASQIGDIDFLVCGASPGITDTDCGSGQVRQGGIALQGNASSLGVAFFPFTDGEVALGRSGSRWADLETITATIGGNLTLNGGSVPSPTSGQGTLFSNTTNGINIFGYGSVYDISLVNYEGVIAAGVPSGTTNFAVIGSLSVGTQQTARGTLVLNNTAAGAYSTTIQSSNSATAAYAITLPVAAPGANGDVMSFTTAGVASFVAPNTTATYWLDTSSVPTLSTCGTSTPSVATGSTNQGGQFTTGGTSDTACTVTFANAYPNYAFCTVSNASSSGGTPYISAQSKTAFTVTGTVGSGVYQYACNGN